MKLKNYLKTSKKARKVFGKKELEIIFKQLEGCPLKQSEKNRISRDIKPKLEFIKEINEFKDEFGLEKNQDNKRLIEKAIDVILNDELKDNIKAVLLFGSYADNTYIWRSDIDICVLFKKPPSSEEATRFRIRISGKLPEKFDIQVFNSLPFNIRWDIARNHKILYKTKDFDNISFSIRYLKDEDYFIRRKRFAV